MSAKLARFSFIPTETWQELNDAFPSCAGFRWILCLVVNRLDVRRESAEEGRYVLEKPGIFAGTWYSIVACWTVLPAFFSACAHATKSRLKSAYVFTSSHFTAGVVWPIIARSTFLMPLYTFVSVFGNW